MALYRCAARRRGFTLIELLLAMVVIAILALIVIPKLLGASRQAEEATLKANLCTLHHACEEFDTDCFAYPATLADLSVPSGGTPKLASGAYLAGSYKGPYLTGQGGVLGGPIPINPFVPSGVTLTELTGTTCVGEGGLTLDL